MDETVTYWLNMPAGISPVLDGAVIAITNFGVPLVVFCVAVRWWSKADRAHVRHAPVAAGLSFLPGLAFNQVLLLFIHRVRPYDAGLTHLIVQPSADWSFPSDHATAAFAAAAAFSMQNLSRRAGLLLVLALLVSWSRIFVGTHYASDVIGGALTGVAAAIVLHVTYREETRLDRFVTGIL